MTNALKKLPVNPLLAGLLILLLTACGQVGLSEDESYQRALQHQASGDLRGALIDFKNVLQQNPSHAGARVGLGLVSLELGDIGTARVELQRARDLGLDPETLAIPFGRLWLAEGEYQRVLENLTISEKDPVDVTRRAQTLQLRGEATLALGRPAQAMAYFEQTMAIEPGAVLPHVGIAGAHMAEGRVEAARASLQTALEKDQRTHQAWNLLGDIERTEGRWEQAASNYGEALKTSPTPYLIHLNRALTSLQLGDTPTAEKDLAAMRRVNADHPATHYLEGLLHLDAGRYGEAQSALQASLSRAEDFQAARFSLGASLMAQEQWVQAEQHLERVLRDNPESIEAARLVAALRTRAGDLERAEQLLGTILDRNPDDPIALNLMGNVYLARGETEAGISNLRRLASNRPEDPASRVLLATALVQSGDSKAGMEEFEAAPQQVPAAFELEVGFIVSLIQGGEFQSALAAADRLIARLPDNPTPHNLKAAAHLGAGDTGAARASLLEAMRAAPGDPVASINLAQLALAAGDADEAKRIYRQSLAHNPGDVDVSMRLSFLEAQSGNVGAMRQVLEASVERHPEALAPRLVLGRHYLANNEPRRVLNLLEQVRRSAAGDPEMLSLLARAQIAAGLESQAVTTLRELSARIPETADSQHLAGQYFEQAGSAREARLQYLKALAIEPDHPAALGSLAALDLREGRVDEALTFARRMQGLTETAATGHALEGQVLALRAKHEDASLAYERAYEIEPSANHATLLGQAMQRAGRSEDAANVLSKHLASHPDEQGVRFELAQTLTLLGNRTDAIREYEDLIRTQPDNPIVLNNLAYLYYGEQDPRALELAERAFALLPGNPAIAHTLGRILLDSGDTERGLNLLTQARDALPEHPEVRFNYAVALVANERRAEAREELSGLLESVGEFPQRAEAESLLDTLR